MTVEVKRGESTITILLDDIQSIEVDHQKQTAFVLLRNGASYGCSNPGAVRDAWVKWNARRRRTVRDDRPKSIFEAIFGK